MGVKIGSYIEGETYAESFREYGPGEEIFGPKRDEVTGE
jgi:hypothetical protein